jgi:hypothetical protein
MNNNASDTVAIPKQPILTKQVKLPQFGDLETHWADDASPIDIDYEACKQRDLSLFQEFSVLETFDLSL